MTRPEDGMTDDELLAYLRDQFDEPTLSVEYWMPETFRAFVPIGATDEHYINEEYAVGDTWRDALLDCIRVHGHMMKREGMRR